MEGGVRGADLEHPICLIGFHAPYLSHGDLLLNTSFGIELFEGGVSSYEF